MNRSLILLQSLALLPVILVSNRAAALVLAIAVVAAATRRQPLGRVVALPPLLALLGFGAASALWSVDPGNTLGKVAQLAGIAIAAFALAGTAERWSDADREVLARAALVGWGVAVAIPLLDLAAHDAIAAALRAAFGEFSRLKAPHLVEKAGVTAMVLATFPALAALRRIGAPKPLFPLLLALAAAAAVTVDGSAALLLSVTGGAAWLLHARWPRLMRDLLRFGVPAAVLAMPLLPMLVDPLAAIQAVPQINTSNFYRLTIWDFVYRHIVEQPWLGWGLDAARVFPGAGDKFTILIPDYRGAPLEFTAANLPLHPHNGPLQLWLELGGVGAALVAVCLWRAISSAVAPEREDAPMAALFAAATVPFLVSFGVFQSWWLALVVLLWAATRALVPRAG